MQQAKGNSEIGNAINGLIQSNPMVKNTEAAKAKKMAKATAGSSDAGER